MLPVASFASGHTFFVQRLFEFQKVKPYVVHTTFQVRVFMGGVSGRLAGWAALGAGQVGRFSGWVGGWVSLRRARAPGIPKPASCSCEYQLLNQPLIRLPADPLFERFAPPPPPPRAQYGGSSGKRNRLREAMLWVDPPEYYGADGGALAACLGSLPLCLIAWSDLWPGGIPGNPR